MIYFMQAERTGLVKIGYSSKIKQRRQGLQAKYGPLAVLCVIKGNLYTERDLHQKFSLDRVTGEWFRASSDLVGAIELLVMTGQTIDFDKIPGDARRITLRLPTQVALAIQGELARIQETRPTFSMNDWIIEASEEKLGLRRIEKIRFMDESYPL